MSGYMYQGIDVSKLTDEEVYFFIRIRGKTSYFKSIYTPSLLTKFKNLKKYRTISEYRKDADIHINLNKIDSLSLSENESLIFDACVDKHEVIQRCRGLRSISYQESTELILRCCLFFNSFFKDSPIKLIVMGAVDNYVMDIMARIAKYYGVRLLGITEFFLAPNYKLVTVYGEHNSFCEPTDEEVRSVCSDLYNKSKSVLAISKRKAILKALYGVGSYFYRVIFRYLIRYKLLGDHAYEYRFAPYFSGLNKLEQLLGPLYLSDISTVESLDPKKSVYIPLHYFPEATIDYWVQDPNDVDYLRSLISVVTYYSNLGYKVVIKEHPAFYLLRPLKYYKKLLEIDGVVILNPFITTKSIFSKVNNVVVWTGSTGVEALFAGLNVKIVTENYYSNGLLRHYKDTSTNDFDNHDRFELIRHVIKTSLKIDKYMN